MSKISIEYNTRLNNCCRLGLLYVGVIFIVLKPNKYN